MHSKNSFNARQTLTSGTATYQYYSLPEAQKTLGAELGKLPFSLKILLENLLRYEDDNSVTPDDIRAFADWAKTRNSVREIAYRPARVLMQDFTGVPAVVDLAAMRDAMVGMGKDASLINPLSPVDMVIDHSVQVDEYGTKDAFKDNVRLEMERNAERYAFLRWGQKAFNNFRVVPPGTGICHQVNLEYLGQCAWTSEVDGKHYVYPDTLVGTDSHTTMVNGLGILGWGVGGIEAEAAMLGQPISMMIPEVVGFKLTGKTAEGITATDLVLTVTQMLRKKGVVGKFVEFYGDGLDNLPLADRATIANMAPEYGATCGIFPFDQETLNYLRLTGRSDERIALVEAYAKAQGMWRMPGDQPLFTDTLELDMGTVVASIAGPKRPQDRIILADATASFKALLDENSISTAPSPAQRAEGEVRDGDVVIAAITSCTNTSNPYVMLAAGLVARNAHARGMKVKPWVKTSLAPGSQVVTEYLNRAGLQSELDAMGFNLVGYGCTTCIGNSGPLKDAYEESIKNNKLLVASVLSGNRNFEGRVHQLVRANYLASPPLVVAYALAGSMNIDITKEAIGQDAQGKDVFLRDIWPSAQEVSDVVAKCVTREMFLSKYADVFTGPAEWQSIVAPQSQTYKWEGDSTYVRQPSFFENIARPANSEDIVGARVLAMLGDSITTDHISPAGSIAPNSAAAKYLESQGVQRADWNSYGARRGNHEVMMRGTFANIRIKNEMAGSKEGSWAKYLPTGEEMSIFDASMKYQEAGTPLVIIAGKEYGTGSSRDWAAKGTTLLGVKAVIAESFERIHRSNLIGMGVLPLTFQDGQTRLTLGLDGSESITLAGLNGLRPRVTINAVIEKDGVKREVPLLVRIDTLDELGYYRDGGILRYVLKNLAA